MLETRLVGLLFIAKRFVFHMISGSIKSFIGAHSIVVLNQVPVLLELRNLPEPIEKPTFVLIISPVGNSRLLRCYSVLFQRTTKFPSCCTTMDKFIISRIFFSRNNFNDAHDRSIRVKQTWQTRFEIYQFVK